MKKSVVSALAAAVILGGASVPAYAAQNPFSDVNEHHWAYHSVTELAEAGIVTGYDNSDPSLNGKFVGGRNITRYEMAQMIAKTLARIEGESSPFAIQLRGHQWTFVDNSGVRRVVDGTVVPFKLSNGATVDMDKLNQLEALVYELQDELTALGMRVDDLEAHSDKVRWGGKIEYTYKHRKIDDGDKYTSNGYVFRLEPVAYIDDNHWESGHYVPDSERDWKDDELHGTKYHHGHWSARARLDSNGDMSDDTTNDTKLKRVWAQGDYDNFQIKLGRFEFYTNEQGLIWDTELSGAQVSLSKGAFKATVLGGRLGSDKVGYPDYLNSSATSYAGAVNDWATNPADHKFGESSSTVVGINLQYDPLFDSTEFKKGVFGGLSWYHVKDDDLWWVSKDIENNKATIWGANLGYRFNSNFKLSGSYARNSKADFQKDAWQAELRYGNYANASAKGQWAVWAGYRKFGQGVSFAGTTNDDILLGYKGWFIGAAYAPFKNIGLIAKYGDNKPITGDSNKVKNFFGRVEFFF